MCSNIYLSQLVKSPACSRQHSITLLRVHMYKGLRIISGHNSIFEQSACSSKTDIASERECTWRSPWSQPHLCLASRIREECTTQPANPTQDLCQLSLHGSCNWQAKIWNNKTSEVPSGRSGGRWSIVRHEPRSHLLHSRSSCACWYCWTRRLGCSSAWDWCSQIWSCRCSWFTVNLSRLSGKIRCFSCIHSSTQSSCPCSYCCFTSSASCRLCWLCCRRHICCWLCRLCCRRHICNRLCWFCGRR